MRFGQCRAMVDHKTGPVPCTHWAVSEKGWCGQHYVSEVERERRATREAERKAELNARIDASLRAKGEEPHNCNGWDCPFNHRSPTHVCDPECAWSPKAQARSEARREAIKRADEMMAGAVGVEPTRTVLETARPAEARPSGRRPFRLTEIG